MRILMLLIYLYQKQNTDAIAMSDKHIWYDGNIDRKRDFTNHL